MEYLSEEEGFAPGENTVVDLLTVAVCDYLNEDTPLSQLDAQTKEAIGTGIHQTIGRNLTEIVEALKNLEPLMCAILQGPLATKLPQDSPGVEAARIAFEAMCEGNKLIQGARSE